ncbi:MAG TPA: biotin/lipoyl-binding protein, partial [Planctomycetota bacterium]|nr:biotin/lipoyl-binding protein [Planctomycetota bacterium]
MAVTARRIFRERPLERVSSPEGLDQLLRVVGPRNWFALAISALALGVALAWSLLGRVPITVEGQALLVRPRQVVSFQAPAEGRVSEVAVQVGDRVVAGQVLARMALPDLQKDLEQQRANLFSLEGRHSELDEREREQAELAQSLLADQRDLLEQRMQSLAQRAEASKVRNAELIAQQRSNLGTARRLSEELESTLEQR